MFYLASVSIKLSICLFLLECLSECQGMFSACALFTLKLSSGSNLDSYTLIWLTIILHVVSGAMGSRNIYTKGSTFSRVQIFRDRTFAQ